MNPVLLQAKIIMCLFGIGSGLRTQAFSFEAEAVPPFIATLGMMVSIEGSLAYIITGGLRSSASIRIFLRETLRDYLKARFIPKADYGRCNAVGDHLPPRRRAQGAIFYGVGGNEEASRAFGRQRIEDQIPRYNVAGFCERALAA